MNIFSSRVGLVASMVVLVSVLAVCASETKTADVAALQQEVRATETAFAQTMADRDPSAFATFIADEAVFFGGKGEIRGRQAVVSAWAGLFEGEQAPFSWKPETVAVLDSGTLALSSGPVFSPDGKQTGTFQSIWRRKADGTWEIVFDKGCPYCEEK